MRTAAALSAAFFFALLTAAPPAGAQQGSGRRHEQSAEPLRESRGCAPSRRSANSSSRKPRWPLTKRSMGIRASRFSSPIFHRRSRFQPDPQEPRDQRARSTLCGTSQRHPRRRKRDRGAPRTGADLDRRGRARGPHVLRQRARRGAEPPAQAPAGLSGLLAYLDALEPLTDDYRYALPAAYGCGSTATLYGSLSYYARLAAADYTDRSRAFTKTNSKPPPMRVPRSNAAREPARARSRKATRHRESVGSIASRRPSPSRLKPNTSVVIASPGKINAQGAEVQ